MTTNMNLTTLSKENFKFNQTDFLILTKGEKIQSESEFELKFRKEFYDELNSWVKNKSYVPEFFIQTESGKEIRLQHFHCVEVEEPKPTQNYVTAWCLGVVMNKKLFGTPVTRVLMKNDNTPSEITEEIYTI